MLKGKSEKGKINSAELKGNDLVRALAGPSYKVIGFSVCSWMLGLFSFFMTPLFETIGIITYQKKIGLQEASDRLIWSAFMYQC
jgi:hypothetical protein